MKFYEGSLSLTECNHIGYTDACKVFNYALKTTEDMIKAQTSNK
jgi:hypothetical protein